MSRTPLPDPATLDRGRRPARLYAIDVTTKTKIYRTVRGDLSPEQLVVQDRSGRPIETYPVDEGTLADPARVEPVGVDNRGRPLRVRGAGKVLTFESGGSPVRVTIAASCTCKGWRVIDLAPEPEEGE